MRHQAAKKYFFYIIVVLCALMKFYRQFIAAYIASEIIGLANVGLLIWDVLFNFHLIIVFSKQNNVICMFFIPPNKLFYLLQFIQWMVCYI